MNPKTLPVGPYARDCAERTALVGVGFALLAAAALWLFVTILPHAQSFGLALIVVLFLVVKGLMGALEPKAHVRLADETRSHQEPVNAEKVGEIVNRLGENYLLLHDVRCAAGDIEHILLSKDHGVFVIETEPSSDDSPSGTERMARTQKKADWLSAQFERMTEIHPPVSSVVVSKHAFVGMNRPPSGTTMTDMNHLVEKIEMLGRPLPPEVWADRESIVGQLN